MQPEAAVLIFFLLCADSIWLWVLLLLVQGVSKWPFVEVSQEPLVDRLPEVPEVTIFIPARNEEQHLDRALHSVLAQDYPNFSIRLIDDQSTDETYAIAQRFAQKSERLAVTKGDNRPSGWLGKPWALHQVTRGASSDFFLFVDADVILHPQALSQAVAHAHKYHADLLSFSVNVELRSFWQRVVGITSALLVAAAAPLVRVNDPKKSAAFAAGGFMLFRQQAYRAIGGHEAVKRQVVEDVALARKVKQHGLRLVLLSAPDLVKTHYYGDFRDIWLGTRKTAYAFSRFRFGPLLAYTVLLCMAFLVPWLGVFLGLFQTGWDDDLRWTVLAASSPGVVVMVVLTGAMASFTHSSLFYAFCAPLGVIFFLANACESTWRFHFGSGIAWKGRRISGKDPVVPL